MWESSIYIYTPYSSNLNPLINRPAIQQSLSFGHNPLHAVHTCFSEPCSSICHGKSGVFEQNSERRTQLGSKKLNDRRKLRWPIGSLRLKKTSSFRASGFTSSESFGVWNSWPDTHLRLVALWVKIHTDLDGVLVPASWEISFVARASFKSYVEEKALCHIRSPRPTGHPNPTNGAWVIPMALQGPHGPLSFQPQWDQDPTASPIHLRAAQRTRPHHVNSRLMKLRRVSCPLENLWKGNWREGRARSEQYWIPTSPVIWGPGLVSFLFQSRKFNVLPRNFVGVINLRFPQRLPQIPWTLKEREIQSNPSPILALGLKTLKCVFASRLATILTVLGLALLTSFSLELGTKRHKKGVPATAPCKPLPASLSAARTRSQHPLAWQGLALAQGVALQLPE